MAKKNIVNRIKTWDEANQALRRMGEIDIAVGKIEGVLTLDINALRYDADAKTKPLHAEREDLEANIEAFCEEHKEDFAKTRSKEFTFGTIAFRVVEKIVIRSKEACLAAMHALKLDHYIRTVEEPDKEAMRDLDDAVLAKVGAKRKIEDKLRIEPAIEKIKEAA